MSQGKVERQSGPPATERGMIQWLKDHPDEPFYTIHSGPNLLIGTRNDEGDLWAYRCKIEGHLWRKVKPARPSRKEDALRRRISTLEARLSIALRHAQPPGMWMRTVNGCQYLAARGRVWSRRRAPKERR